MSKRNFTIVENGTHYQLPEYEVLDGKGIELVDSVLDIRFARGSKLKDEPVERREGTLHEHLLSMMIHDLKYKGTLVPSRENSLVVTKLEEALFWLEERTKMRELQGTLGTYKK